MMEILALDADEQITEGHQLDIKARPEMALLFLFLNSRLLLYIETCESFPKVQGVRCTC